MSLSNFCSGSFVPSNILLLISFQSSFADKRVVRWTLEGLHDVTVSDMISATLSSCFIQELSDFAFSSNDCRHATNRMTYGANISIWDVNMLRKVRSYKVGHM